MEYWTSVKSTVDKILSEMDLWLVDLDKKTKKHYHIYHEGVVYKYWERRFWPNFFVPYNFSDNGEMADRSSNFRELYQLAVYIFFLYFIQENRNSLINSVVDESVPYVLDDLLEDWDELWVLEGDLWRVSNAELLALYQVQEAVPVLIEAWLHDTSWRMRKTCLNALIKMRNLESLLPQGMVDTLIAHLHKVKGYEKVKIIELLGNVWDARVVPVLSDFIVDAAYNIELYEKEILGVNAYVWLYPSEIVWDSPIADDVNIYIQSMEVLLKLDPQEAVWQVPIYLDRV